MEPRLNFLKIAPDGYKAMSGVEAYVSGSGIDHTLLHLIKVRASQINACAFCIDMHWKDARAAGETEQRLYGLSAWQDSPYYTDRERAMLKWVESVTLLSQTHAPDADYEALRQHFDEKETVNLTWAIAAINAWNRMAAAFRSPAGVYQPAKKQA